MNDELKRLRAAQAKAVMPLIGALLDAWDGMETDEKAAIEEASPDFAEAMEAIVKAMDAE